MAEKIFVPESGELGDEIILLKWHKDKGEAISAGDVVAEIEAQKGVLEIEAHSNGHMISLMVQEGASLSPGEILGYIGTPGEEIPAEKSGGNTAPNGPGTVKIMPAARNLAGELGIDPASIAGKGPEGVITVADVEAAGGKSLLTKNQRAVAATVSASHREIPVIHLTADIDMTKAKHIQEQGIRFDAMLIKAAAMTFKGNPKFNRVMEKTIARECPFQGIGYALSVGGDLYTPLVSDPRTKSLEEIDAELEGLIDQVFDGNIPMKQLKGFTLLLSNLGMYDITGFDAIIPPGASAALALGAIRDKPVVLDGELTVRPVMKATLTVDHRVINGADGAKYLATYKKRLENITLGEE